MTNNKMLPAKEISVLYFLSAVVYSCILVFLLPYVRNAYVRNVFFDTPLPAKTASDDVAEDGTDSNEDGEKRNDGAKRETTNPLQPLAIEGEEDSNDNERSSKHSQHDDNRESVVIDRESVMSRLSVEGHVTFDPSQHNANLPSGDLPHNPGNRVDRHFRESVRQHNMTQVEDSLRNGADITLRSTMAYSILHEAIAVNVGLSAIHTILDRCPDLLNAQSSHGTTPLMLAITSNRMHLARLLLEKGAKVNAQNDQGHTALMLGAMRNIPWAAMFLLPWGADSELVDADGRRAVDLALLYGNARVASDLQGSALAVVPGYIAPKVQNNYDGLSLIYTIAWHGFDVATDVLLAMNLSKSGHPILAIFTALFLLLPSFFIFMIPYQTFIERLLTLLQMRIVYEGLISMGQERLTVRFGATRMYHTVLQNVPQSILQSFMLALVLRGNNNFGGDKLSLGLAIASTIYQSTTTFHNMYLMRFFTVNNDSGTEKLQLRIFLIVGILLGVALRVAMWASAVLLFPKGVAFVFFWVFLTRYRLIGVGNELHPDKTSRARLELTVVDLFVTFLCDVPFLTVPSCYLASLLLSALELVVVLAPCFRHWHEYQAVNALISCFWLWITFSLGLVIYIHGSYCSLPDSAFWKRFFSPYNLLLQVLGLVRLAINNVIFSVTFLYLEAKAAWMNCFNKSKKASVLESSSKRRRNKGPVAPPMLHEPWWKTVCGCPKLSWKALEGRERWSMLLVFIILSLLACFLVSLLGHCHQVSSQLWEDDYYAHNHMDDRVDDDRTNTYQGIKCTPGFDDKFGFFAYSVAPYALCAFVLIYFIEAVTCKLSASLRNLFSEESAYNRYVLARSMAPSFYWYSESYHMETRTYTTTESDGKGGSRTVTKTETVRVVTHTASMYYHFDYWIDDSAPFPHGVKLCRIQSKNVYEFDTFTQNDFDTKFSKFKVENDRDVHQNCSSTFQVGGSSNQALPAMLTYAQAAPYFLRYTYYLCAVVLLLAPWYRWSVASISTLQTVPIIKKVRTMNPNEQVENGDILDRYGSPDLDKASSKQQSTRNDGDDEGEEQC